MDMQEKNVNFFSKAELTNFLWIFLCRLLYLSLIKQFDFNV